MHTNKLTKVGYVKNANIQRVTNYMSVYSTNPQ